MEEQRVIRLGVLNQPVHGSKNVGFGRLTHGVLLVISQQNHILTGIPKVLVQVIRHVFDIVYATPQLALLAEVVDSNHQRLSLARAARILETVALRCAMTEGDGVAGRGSRTATLTVTLVYWLVIKLWS